MQADPPDELVHAENIRTRAAPRSKYSAIVPRLRFLQSYALSTSFRHRILINEQIHHYRLMELFAPALAMRMHHDAGVDYGRLCTGS